jgi:hypothetical protein
MFEFLKRGRNKQGPDANPTAEARPSQSFPSVPDSSQQHATTSRELVRVVLRDTLRMNNIPPDWISCESAPATPGRSDGGLLIQLVIRRWHEGLMAYAPLLQQQFLQALQRFDPASDHAHHVVVWKFSPTCGYPGTTMPAADFWSPKPAFAAKRKFDLPASDLDNLTDDFAPTVPGEFR